MTGDRRLKPHELRMFMQHGSLGMDTLKEMLFIGGEPSLFEAALIEIMAALEVHFEHITEQGARINLLERQVKVLMSLESTIRLGLRRLDELDEKLEELKQILMDDIAELRKMAEVE